MGNTTERAKHPVFFRKIWEVKRLPLGSKVKVFEVAYGQVGKLMSVNSWREKCVNTFTTLLSPSDECGTKPPTMMMMTMTEERKKYKHAEEKIFAIVGTEENADVRVLMSSVDGREFHPPIPSSSWAKLFTRQFGHPLTCQEKKEIFPQLELIFGRNISTVIFSYLFSETDEDEKHRRVICVCSNPTKKLSLDALELLQQVRKQEEDLQKTYRDLGLLDIAKQLQLTVDTPLSVKILTKVNSPIEVATTTEK